MASVEPPKEIEEILGIVASYYPEADFELLRRAFVFVSMEHQGQLRQSGEPFLIHPVAVARILAEMRLDVTSIATGLLHDVVEDTQTPIQVIEEYFGADVAHLVEGVTKLSKITFRSREERQAENFRKMLLAMVDDIRVILVKLADRLHNMRTLGYMPPEKQRAIARETLDIYAPLAHRLGMGRMKEELEELGFQYSEPERYEVLRQKLEQRRKVDQDFVARAQEEMEEKLREAGVPAEISGRVKGLLSIQRKLQAQKIDIEEVYDYLAFRVLTDSVRNCYAALGIIHGHWRPVPGRIKDFIAMPKANNYQSLHTTVIGEKGHPFEVQIRTPEMHRVAEEGIAAHWKYKGGRVLDDADVRQFAWLRGLFESQKEMADSRDFLSVVKMDLYPDEVYAFTPRGEVRSFPRGATPIDFAYSVHTEIGHRCVGAKINGKMVSLKSELQNGDIVEILTSPSHNPSRDWLKIAATSRALSKIRHWLNVHEREASVDLGRSQLDREARRYDVNLRKAESSGTLAQALSDLGYPSLEDFQAAIGYGKTTPEVLLRRLVPGDLREKIPGPIAQTVRKVLRLAPADRKMVVRGQEDILTSLAKCCNPIRGDAIVGYITRGRGVSIHRSNCSNVESLLYDPGRRIEVAWDEQGEGTFDVTLSVTTEDRPGMLAAVTTGIAQTGTNIRNVSAHTTESRKGEIQILIEVRDTAHLTSILDLLHRLNGVTHVEKQ